MTVLCPALFLSAPASGQGKTTITAGLSRYFKNQGKTVRVFKTGPDYLDPQILAQASGEAVEPLDLWMAGENDCKHKLYEAAKVADLILIEGAMGMFDGDPSSADLAATFGIPIAIVMDVKGMAQTAAALASGLANFRNDYQVAGLIVNNCGSERHSQLIRDALPESLPLIAALPRNPEVTLPERHLGLVQAAEIRDELEQCIERAAVWIKDAGLTELPAPVAFEPTEIPQPKKLLQDRQIGIAKDEAFSFIYDANIELLEAMGAECHYFSPIHDSYLPEVDALWFPGGYPELHATKLAENDSMAIAIREFFEADKTILAECGGFLYTMETLTDLEGNIYPMLGLMQGHGAMRGRSGCQGMQTAVLPEGDVRAHAHHRSRSESTPEPIGHGRRQRHPAPGEAIYRERGLTATYLHLFFPSNAEAVASMFSAQD
ncbi:cobyrinate a,c-diamide synthase [Leucothrix arctica]|uniref:Cobyrinate a,c-diamide synthase n=1 Tax=Leucothrix arctica TaxID=1481894 RepID=A0A317CAF5_9GAMM|nr:cobyrinate a,c-diamide synthase [Leucothrix arctica]PWQ95528.1 cobyrinate a,c-diamide synthase [Leucothrix arctica]